VAEALIDVGLRRHGDREQEVAQRQVADKPVGHVAVDQKGNVSNLLIGNLALSDFLLSVAVLPLSAVNECLGHWVFGRTACNAWLLVDVFLCTASIWNLCLIAFDRFTATFYPLWYRGKGRANSHHALAYAAAVWVVAAIACMPPMLGWNDLAANYIAEGVDSTGACSSPVRYRCVLFRSPSYVLFSASVSFFIPCLVTFILRLSRSKSRKRTIFFHQI